jgi:hypothetical protein
MSKTLTYEQMMALFAEGHKETAELRKEHEKGMAELRSSIAESSKEHEKGMTELRSNIAESSKKHEEGMAELRSGIADLRIIVNENNERLERNTHEMGLLTNKLGGVVESIVLPGIVGKFNEKGFSFDSVSTRVKFLTEEKYGNLAEVDALLENGKFVIAVEAKTDMQVSDVNKHIKRLNILRGIPRFKGKKIYGAFSTAIARKKPVDYALENGFYVLQQPDVMGVKILDFPKGHHAKAW